MQKRFITVAGVIAFAALLIAGQSYARLYNPPASGGATVNSGTTNYVAYYSSASAISAIASVANGILSFNGSGVPVATTTLPTAVQDLITRVGTITAGVWSGTALVDAKVDNDLTISGGTVNNSVIGGTTAAAGTFTTLIGTNTTASSTLTIPFGTAPTVTASGTIAVDTTDDQFKYVGATTRVLPYEYDKCFGLADLVAADDNLLTYIAPENITLTSAACKTSSFTTEPTITFEDDAGNAMTGAPTCSSSTASTYTAFTAGNTLVAGEGLRIDTTNTPAPTSATQALMCVRYTYDAQ